MNTQAPVFPEDLFRVTLVDGLAVERDGKTIRYRTVNLRETSVADERAATQLAERVVMFQGQPRLLASDSEFRFAMTMMHIESFVCDSLKLDRTVINLDLLGKLSPRDLGRIEARVFLINMAAEVRYGNLGMDKFMAAWKGDVQPDAAPQPVGQATDVGAGAAGSEPGPAMLADFAGTGAGGQAAGLAS